MPVLEKQTLLNAISTFDIEDWLEYLREKEDEQIITNIRKYLMVGRQCGNDRFMKKLEKLFGRRLRALSWMSLLYLPIMSKKEIFTGYRVILY